MHAVVMESLEEYLAGSLEPADERAIEAHLVACDSCREEIRGIEDVSRLFAKRAEPEIGTLRGQRFTLGATGAPILEDCLAFLECRVASVHDGGDHSIFLGKVIDGRVVRDVKPLLFFRGKYHGLTDGA